MNEVVEVKIGRFIIKVWQAIDGFMWRAETAGRIGETFGPFGEFETAVASGWQWLKDGNFS